MKGKEKQMYDLLKEDHYFKKYSGPTRLKIVKLMVKAYDKGYNSQIGNRAM